MISFLLVLALLIAWHLHLTAVSVILTTLAALNLGFLLGRLKMRRDILLVRGFADAGPDRVRAIQSADEMREAYRKAGLQKPIILNAPDHIRVERIKTL